MFVLLLFGYVNNTGIQQILAENVSRAKSYSRLNYKMPSNMKYIDGLYFESGDYSFSENASFNEEKHWIYAGEFLISAIPSALIGSYQFLSMMYAEKHWEKEYILGYIVANATLTPIGTFVAGKLFKQKGSFWKSIAGATIGSLVGCVIVHYNSPAESNIPLLLILPPLGATIGYNL